jgi:predicted RNA-binding Zn-ribbon protein involved in translation (DUF1610 family)
VAIQVHCSHCNAKLTTDDSKAGRKAKCPKCGGVIEIPMPPSLGVDDVLEAEVDPFRGLSDNYELEDPAPAPTSTSTGDRKPCPMCGEMIASDAVKCRYCGEIFDPVLKKTAKKAYSSEDENLTVGEWVLGILCSGIACIVAIVWMIQGKPKGKKLLFVALAVQAIGVVIQVIIGALAQQ